MNLLILIGGIVFISVMLELWFALARASRLDDQQRFPPPDKHEGHG